MLKNYCHKYNNWVEELEQLERYASLGGLRCDGMPRGNAGCNSSTESIAIRIVEIERNISVLQQCAMRAGSDIWKYIFRYVTERDTGFQTLQSDGLKCSRSSFFRYIDRFYWYLDFEKKGEV